MGELDLDRDGAVTFVEFMRPTAKKYKEELELENVGHRPIEIDTEKPCIARERGKSLY